MPQPGPSGYQPPSSSYQPPPSSYQPPLAGANSLAPNPGLVAPPTTPSDPPGNTVGGGTPQPAPTATRYQPPANPYGVSLRPEDYQRAMKLCKYAGSALQYEDSKTAIDNLTRALNLLTSGKE
jgi:vacuolar protein sorting-associated protein VTA1